MVSITSKSLQVAAEALAVADEVEHPNPSLTKPAKIKQGIPDVLSLEDIAWADSCLIRDPDISQIDWKSWSSFTDALNETLSSETNAPVARVENHPEGAVIEFSPSGQQIGGPEILDPRADDDSSIADDADNNSEDQLMNEHFHIFQSEMNLENALLPTWKENLEKFGDTGAEEGVDFPGFAMEQSNEDIFKVWDLNLPAEEDDFINQFNKSFNGSPLEPFPSVSDDSGLANGLKEITIDDIISGMSDLSLSRFPL